MLRSRPQTCRGAASSARARASVSARAAATVDAPKASAVEIPEALKNNVVVLEAPNSAGNPAQVYVVGVSHVSKRQAEGVKQLIRRVRPEVVAVELCKDRVGLLVDDRLETQATNLWHVRKILIEGLPSYDKAFPSADELLSLLDTRSGRPVTMQDIEADVLTLQSTGLFRSVMPGAANGTLDDAPEFGVLFGNDGDASLETIPPLAGLRFTVTMRELPPMTEFSVRVDSSLADAKPDEAALAQVCADAVEQVKEAGKRPLTELLRARARFSEVAGTPVVVAFNGVETGRVEAIIKAPKPTDPSFVSGFEGSAVNGEGFGIDTFRPARPLTQVSSKMYLATSTLEAMRSEVRGLRAGADAGADPTVPSADDGSTPPAARGAAAVESEFRVWDAPEIETAARSDPEPAPVADALRGFLTLAYAQSQTKVGRKVGIERGAAWQAALQAASEVGTQQLLLADRPTRVTERRLGDAMLAQTAPRLVGGVALVLGSIITAVVADAPIAAEVGGVAASAAAAAALAWPIWGPLAQIDQLAKMDADGIEAAVLPPGPLASGAPGKLFGEDALLEWPGAGDALLAERDAFMACTGAGAAAGVGVVPGYVLDCVNGQPVWRFMQAKGALPEACPPGFGDGEFVPLQDVSAVVHVVGTAHVPGIMARWAGAVKDPRSQVDALLRTDGESTQS